MSALLDDGYVPAWPEHLSQRPALRLVASNDVVERPVLRSTPSSAPARLTRRGVAVLSAAVAVLAVALVWLAARSAPSTAASAPAITGNSVAVAPGDSLWSIAQRVAPNRDPRAEVALLQRLNHLAGSATLVPGQVLRIHR